MPGYLKKVVDRATLLYNGGGSNKISRMGNSLMISWIQNRLREYFLILQARIERSRTTIAPHFSPILKADSFDVLAHELMVLDIQLPTSTNGLNEDEWDDFIDIMNGTNTQKRPRRSEHEHYRTAQARLSVTYQESRHSHVETLFLLAQVGQIEDLSLVENLDPFIYLSEKHGIDIYTKVFPILEDLAKSKGVSITIPVPKCYFGTSEDGEKVLFKEPKWVPNDIISKVGAGMEVHNKAPVYQSHRLLLLEDVERNGFELKNVDRSAFLPLLNVKAALKEISIIHCTSWAFAKLTKKNLTTVWPFISNIHYLPSLKMRAKLSFPRLIRLVKTQLEEQGILDDCVGFLSHLNSLQSKLFSTLGAVSIPSSGPLCLIHQAFNSSTSLFRHSFMSRSDLGGDVRQTTLASSTKSGGFQETQRQEEKNREDRMDRKTGMLIKREVRIVDWEHATFGSPMIDVAFIILTSLPPQTRRMQTPALLKLYWDQFEELATSFGLRLSWTAEEIFKEYIHGLLYGCLVIAASSSKQDKEGLDVFIEAIRDLIELKAI